jgi:hypothetical protein
MATRSDDEDQWIEHRTDWARGKIEEWIGRLKVAKSEVEANKLKVDIANMARVLRDWEAEYARTRDAR